MNVSDLNQAVDRYRTAKPSLKSAMQRSAMAIAVALTNERDELEARLTKRWLWCDHHPNHPQLIDREDAVLADLARYEQIEDALRNAGQQLLGRESA